MHVLEVEAEICKASCSHVGISYWHISAYISDIRLMREKVDEQTGWHAVVKVTMRKLG
jgi:hypothetical protein